MSIVVAPEDSRKEVVGGQDETIATAERLCRLLVTRRSILHLGSKTKLFFAGLTIGAVLVTGGLSYAFATGRPASAVSGPRHYTVELAASGTHTLTPLFVPDQLNIYVGDSVTFKTSKKTLEPHTATAGPKRLLAQLAHSFAAPVPQKHGPPILEVSKKAGLPTHSHTYSGGFANSGLLWPSNNKRKSWTIIFTKPGKYHFFCLVHFPFMNGWIIVHPRPRAAKTFTVLAGEGQSTEKTVYFPQNLTVHVGDTVKWIASFHTVTFARSKPLAKIRHHFAVRTPSKSYSYEINPKAALPSRSNGCGVKVPCKYGGGFLNSGLIVGPHFSPSQFMVTFTKPGSYHYGCLVHLHMNGRIRVLP